MADADRLISPRTGIVRTLTLIQKDASEPARPHVISVELANHRLRPTEDQTQHGCSGKGFTLAAARTSALGEAVEHYSAAAWEASEIVYARRRDLPSPTLDPPHLVLYHPEQYAALPYQPYTEENILGWTSGRSLVTGNEIWTPALAVYLDYELHGPDEMLCQITSNGLATGPTLTEAILAAVYEVVERDALMIAWLNRLPVMRIDPGTHPDDDVRALCKAYRRRSIDIQLYRLPTDHPCAVFAAVALQHSGDGPAVVVGMGAEMSSGKAARKALLEVGQVRPTLRQHMRRPEIRQQIEALIADPQHIATPEDHALFYASPNSISRLDFLLDRPVEPYGWQETATAPIAQLESFIEHCRGAGWELIYVNLTPPDMEQMGLHTVRAIVPGLQPIHFGWNEARLGGDRLYELPLRLGLTITRTTLAQLNADPHPLA